MLDSFNIQLHKISYQIPIGQFYAFGQTSSSTWIRQKCYVIRLTAHFFQDTVIYSIVQCKFFEWNGSLGSTFICSFNSNDRNV